MILRKEPPENHFVQIPNSVVDDYTISDGAKVLYITLHRMKLFDLVNDAYLCHRMRVSLRSLTRRKLELKHRDLLGVIMVRPRIYMVYVGTPEFPVSKMKLAYKEKDTEKLR
jgi:hypothetical protein